MLCVSSRRILLVWVFAVDSFQVGSSVAMLWHYVVANFTNPEVLLTGPWEYATLPILSSLSVVHFLEERTENRKLTKFTSQHISTTVLQCQFSISWPTGSCASPKNPCFSRSSVSSPSQRPQWGAPALHRGSDLRALSLMCPSSRRRMPGSHCLSLAMLRSRTFLHFVYSRSERVDPEF